MAPKSRTSTGSTLKQGKLNFAQSKRGATAASKAKASPSLTSVKPQAEEKKRQDSRTISIGSTISINTTTSESHSDDDVGLAVPSGEQHDTKRLTTEAGKAKSGARAVKPVYRASVNAFDSSSDEEPEEHEDLKVLEKNPRIQRLYNQAKARMGDVPPVHSKNQNKINHILRVFDLSYEYGPCVGMTRLQRWERAHALGLNPPAEVREILLTKQGLEDDTYEQCVFYDEV